MASFAIAVALLFYILLGFLTLLSCLFAVFLLYIHYIHRINAHLPGPPRSSFVLGHLPDLRQWRKDGNTTMTFFVKKRLEYGPIYVLFIVHRAVVTIGDPAYLKESIIDNHKFVSKSNMYKKIAFPFGTRFLGGGILTNTDNDSWQKRRQLMNPAFHRKCLKYFMTDFNVVCDRFLARITGIVKQKQEASMANEFSRATLDIIGQVSFNISIGAIEDPHSPFTKAVTAGLRMTQACLIYPLNSTISTIFKYWPFQSTLLKEQSNAVNFLRNFAHECITRRINDIQANKDTPDDLLNILVTDKSLSMEDIIDEFITVFIAGQETTANSLAFTLFEIAQNQDIEKKILDEVNEVLGEKEYVEYEDLPKLKYIGQVLQESLRKYPVARGTSRISSRDLSIGGYKIPKGDEIRVSKVAFNHNPEYWENPDVFDPDRFSTPENIPNFNMVYFPFNVGPRNCIGQHVAKFESKVLLARILRRFQFNLLPGQTGAIEERLTLAPRDGVMCKVVMR